MGVISNQQDRAKIKDEVSKVVIKARRKIVRNSDLFKAYENFVLNPPDFLTDLLTKFMITDYGDVQFTRKSPGEKDIYEFSFKAASLVFSQKKFKIDGENHVNNFKDKPVVFYCNHQSLFEPFFAAGVVWPTRPTIWGDAPLTSLDTFSDYAYNTMIKDWFKDNPLVGRYIADKLVDAFGPYPAAFSTCVGNSENETGDYYIPAYRGERRQETIDRTIKWLKRDRTIIIPPENPAPGSKYSSETEHIKYPETGLREFMWGIAILAEQLHNQRSEIGQHIPFVGMALTGTDEPLTEKGTIGVRFTKPLYFADYAKGINNGNQDDSDQARFKNALEHHLNDEYAVLQNKGYSSRVRSDQFRMFVSKTL